MFAKNLSFFIDSFKSSLRKKPMALIVLCLVVAVSIVVCGWSSRGTMEEFERAAYGSVNIGHTGDIGKATAIGDEMRKLREDGLFEYNATGNFSFAYWELLENNIREDEPTSVSAVVFANELFTESNIANKDKVLAASNYFLEKNNVGVGDFIKFAGVDFEIIATLSDTNEYGYKASFVTFPYPALVELIPSDGSTYKLTNGVSCYFTNMRRPLAKAEFNRLKEVGADIRPQDIFNSASIMFLFILLLFVAICVVNILFVIKYWQKVNDKKYAVYKVLGARPAKIALAMLLEVVCVLAVGVAIGVGIEAALSSLFMSALVVDKLLWLHYTILISITAVATLVPTAIQIVKRSKASAIDRKLLA